ncbi:MAG: hypothetical protein IPP74_00100 [Alphaproteobacteria bacterium]|nr:hypothetical protein [Alphaproteobacteria bacterium]
MKTQGSSETTSIQPILNQWMQTSQINRFGKGKRENDLALEHEQLAVIFKVGVKDRYGLKHAYFLGGTEDLRVLLQHLKHEMSQPDTECLSIVRPYIHAINLYMVNVQGSIHALIVDPQGLGDTYAPNVNIAAALHEAFPGCKIHSSSNQFQLTSDNRNCSVFSYKMAGYFAKHGKAIIQELSTKEGQEQVWNGTTIYSHDTSSLFDFKKKSHNIAGNTAQATQKRKGLRDQILPQYAEKIRLIDHQEQKLNQDVLQQILDEVSGRQLVFARKEACFNIQVSESGKMQPSPISQLLVPCGNIRISHVICLKGYFRSMLVKKRPVLFWMGLHLTIMGRTSASLHN